MEQALRALLPHGELKLAAPMAEYTTFHIGGKAEYLVLPANEEEITAVRRLCAQRGCPLTVIGAGSNLLVGDRGIPGVTLRIAEKMRTMHWEGGLLHAQAGVTLSALAREAARAGRAGLEFACGIPGTVGGGVVMNAGAYGGEMKDVVHSVRTVDAAGNVHTYTAEEMQFAYRHSRVMGTDEIILSASFTLAEGDRAQIEAQIAELMSRRREKQPLHLPSAGSAFKRPANGYASALVDSCGLKGFTVGGAQVSPMHAGFVVNIGNATAADVRTLLEEVSRLVFEATGTRLEPEIRMIGEF